MIKNIYEILKIILPAIIAGLFTFFITKYTYSKNKPLDKLEIAYNRVYYPISRIIENVYPDKDKIIEKCKIYFLKYDKYIDDSTKKSFKSLCACTNKTEMKNLFLEFEFCIWEKCLYLRRKLGYLNSNALQSYKYSTPIERSYFRIIIELFIGCISMIVCIIFVNVYDIIFTISTIILSTFWLLAICEIVFCFLRKLYYKIKK